MTTKIYNKLVRDKIPQIIRNSGKTCITQVLDEPAYVQKLTEKLGEEYQEFLQEINSYNDEQAIKELADIVEVVLALVDAIGVDRSSFENIRKAKVTQNGAFTDKILLKQVDDNL